MPLSCATLARLQTLRETVSQWAPHAAQPERLLMRDTVHDVRAQADEPVSLADLQRLAMRAAPELAPEQLIVERRQRPDPAGEGSIGYYVLLQAREMNDDEYASKIDALWGRRERARQLEQGVNPAEFALYQRLHQRYGQASAEVALS